MSEQECNRIKVSNDSINSSTKNHSYSEAGVFKPINTFTEAKQQKEKSEPKEIKKSKAKAKVLSLMMSAVAVTVVAVPQIDNYISVDIDYCWIESTQDTISYSFGFGNRDKEELYEGEWESDENKYRGVVITVYNDFFSDSVSMEEYGNMVEYTVEDLKPNMEYVIKITNNGTLIFKRTITTNYEYYYFSGGEESHGFNTPEISDNGP